MPSLMAASNCPARMVELSEFSCLGGLPSGPKSAAQFENGPQGRGYNPQARFPCNHRPAAGHSTGLHNSKTTRRAVATTLKHVSPVATGLWPVTPLLFTIRKRPAGPWLQQAGSYARSMYTISPW